MLMILVTIPLLAGTAGAWDFRMSGTWTWEFEHTWGNGGGHLFGPHDVDATAAWNALNFYPGFQFPGTQGNIVVEGVVSGHNAAWATQYASFDMTVQINKALKVQGLYYVGSRDGTALNPVASEYRTKEYDGIQNAFSPGYWNWMRIMAKLPWGDLSFGKRPGRFGCENFWSGDDLTASESVALGVKYGPFKFGLSCYPSRRGPEGYYNEADRSNDRVWNFATDIHYFSGPLAMGMRNAFCSRHRGGERTAASGDDGDGRDLNDWFGGIYLKYNNGRFFANGEFDWFDRMVRRLDAPNGANVDPTTYNEFKSYMLEAGFFAGPAKLTLFHSWNPGEDRRAGRRTSTTYRDPSPALGNTLVYMPYSYLMVYSYGTGVDPIAGGGSTTFNPLSGNGEFAGAWSLAARLDYAIAANLNTSLSYFRAWRPWKGYGWGYLRLDNGACVTPGYIINGDTDTAAAFRTVNTVGNPAIPDDDLGWEVDWTVTWALLEGFVFNSTMAYWQPGNWWKYACTSKSNPGWTAPAPGNNMGADPTRSLDAIMGWNMTVTAEF